jgi:hypothetical protein
VLNRTRGTLHEKWDTETRYTSRAIFYVLFYFDVLFSCKDTNMNALLSENPT